jgi:transcriptional regulator with XRE-family HTH domain
MTDTQEPLPFPVFGLGDHLRKARMSAGLSQEELALRLGITSRSVTNYETDRRRPPAATLTAWAAATSVPLWWFENAKGAPRPSARRPVQHRSA